MGAVENLDQAVESAVKTGPRVMLKSSVARSFSSLFDSIFSDRLSGNVIHIPHRYIDQIETIDSKYLISFSEEVQYLDNLAFAGKLPRFYHWFCPKAMLVLQPSVVQAVYARQGNVLYSAKE